MNQHLETILNFIQQSKKLSADEKNNISKAVKKADDELEHKNHELEIEGSLEQVRAQAMSMMKPDELLKVCESVFRQLQSLGFSEDVLRNSQIVINHDEKEFYYGYQYSDYMGSEFAEVPYNLHPVIKFLSDKLRQSNEAFADIAITGELLDDWKRFVNNFPQKHDDKLNAATELHYYFYSVGIGALGISTFKSITEEQLEILKRFRNVFNLSYQRYTDISLAEAQVREAKIEASLERVRSKAMAMHNSSDLTEAAGTIFTELNKLGINPIRSGFVLLTTTSRRAKLYPATSFDKENTLSFTGDFEFIGHPVFEKQYESWQKQENYFPVLEGEVLKSYYKILAEGLSIPYESFPTNKKQFGSFLPFTEGFLFTWSEELYSEKEINILDRFKAILNLTIRRYLDLQKAEVQAREAQIEAALERVRSKAMAMQKSDDLNAAVATVFAELDKLNIGILRCGIGILSKEKRCADVWTTTVAEQGLFVQVSGDESMDIHPLLQGDFDAWLRQEDFSYVLQGEDLSEYYRAMKKTNFKLPESQIMVEHAKELKHYYYATSFQSGMLFAFRETDFPREEKTVMKRFAGVFNLTYKRFLDIQKAEAQARESQIEAALERVRSKALAMQKGEDLAGAVAIVFDELEKLNLGMIRCGIGILTREKRTADVWTIGISEHGKKVQVSGDESLDIHPLLQGAFDAWLNQHDFSYELKGEDLIHYYRALGNTNFHLPEAKSIVERAQIQPLKQFYYVAPFESGNLFAFRETEFPDEAKKVIRRFADVFNLTYTRFLDLQKAEAQAKEAQLERKRSEDLLLNILPQEIATELKQFGKSYARKHEEVTVLFADIKGFSSISENLSAEELVTQLDECFRAFDKIVEKHGLEKIKTVGDAYVCACGLPKPVPDNAVKTVRAALDMVEFIKGFGMTKRIQNIPAFEFRVGIHTGPVVTGVVGLKKFTYDIWGDAVNLAARMEQHGEAGKINVSGATYQFIKDKFNCTHRGKIQAKNKGEIDMYFVV